jgi:flagellar motor switch protein FliG
MAKEKKPNGLKKVAILLIALGPRRSAAILKNFQKDNLELISAEIANTGEVSPQEKLTVIEEFLELCGDPSSSMVGGLSYAMELLEQTVGPQKTKEIMKYLTAQVKPFGLLRKTDPKQILNFIDNEHPQTIALILSYLDPEQAAAILNSLPKEMQSDIAWRIASMERTSPEIIKEVEAVLEKEFSTIVSHDFTSAGGINALVNILNNVDRGTEKSIIEDLEKEDQELAEEIRKRLFVFEDIIMLDDYSIRRVLKEIDFRDLASALKGSNQEVAEVIYKNMSKRAAEMLKEDIESLGPLRLREVEATQQRIVQTIRRLDEAGEIIIARGGQDAIVV